MLPRYFFLIILIPLIIANAVFAEQLQPSDYKALRALYMQPAELWPKPELDQGIEHKELGLLPLPKFPKNNPLTKAKLELGERLFNDPILSSSGQIACASCHDKDLGWADGRESSFGHNRQKGTRNAPSIENTAFFTKFFWDGRANSLEQQALLPITNPIEMNSSITDAIQRLKQEPSYVEAFKLAFDDGAINELNLAKAIATFERTIISRLSKFDQFLIANNYQGKQRAALSAQMSDQALLGLHLFRTKARCLNCHNGPAMTDNQFHNLGLTYYKREFEDLGLYLTTQNPEDVGKFKTPSLRGVMNTKPWMHNGFFASMIGVLNIYNAGGARNKVDPNDPMSPVVSKHLKPLKLTTEEILALESFMTAVTAYPLLGPSHRVLATIKD